MEISDNGQGFELDGHQTSKKQGRLGLTGMRERAEMIGANFSVASAPGAPTTIRVTVPPPEPGNNPSKNPKNRSPEDDHPLPRGRSGHRKRYLREQLAGDDSVMLHTASSGQFK